MNESQARTANEHHYNSGVSRDFCEADALDPEYLDTEPFDPEAEERWEREGRAEMNYTLFGGWEV